MKKSYDRAVRKEALKILAENKASEMLEKEQAKELKELRAQNKLEAQSQREAKKENKEEAQAERNTKAENKVKLMDFFYKIVQFLPMTFPNRKFSYGFRNYFTCESHHFLLAKTKRSESRKRNQKGATRLGFFTSSPLCLYEFSSFSI